MTADPSIGPKYYGKYKGVITDNNDLTGTGKLEVQVPDVHGTKKLWAQPCAPYAYRDHGFFLMPPNGTDVWVEFAAGDRNQPIWAGFFWPDGGAPAASPDDLVLKTPSGSIEMKSQDKSPQLTIKTTKLTLMLSDGAVTIDADGKGKIEITDQGNVTASSGGTGKVEVSSASTKVNGTSLEVT